MDNLNYKEVSLGFAEFISQLIRETFDAIVSSQSYQLEKYNELNSKLNMSNESFAEEFIDSEQIEQKIKDVFGKTFSQLEIIEDEIIDFLKSNFVDISELIIEDEGNQFSITPKGVLELQSLFSDRLVEEKKGIIRQIINGSNSVNLVVDSGRIEAKLELTNVYSAPPEDVKSKKALKKIKKQTKLNAIPKIISNIKPIKIPGIEGKNDTVIISKEDLKEAGKKDFDIPTLRITANPLKATTSSNLYSIVEINFKSI